MENEIQSSESVGPKGDASDGAASGVSVSSPLDAPSESSRADAPPDIGTEVSKLQRAVDAARERIGDQPVDLDAPKPLEFLEKLKAQAATQPTPQPERDCESKCKTAHGRNADWCSRDGRCRGCGCG